MHFVSNYDETCRVRMGENSPDIVKFSSLTIAPAGYRIFKNRLEEISCITLGERGSAVNYLWRRISSDAQ